MRRFNKKASESGGAVVLCISADLPFAQSRFCGAEGLNNVVTLSTFRYEKEKKTRTGTFTWDGGNHERIPRE